MNINCGAWSARLRITVKIHMLCSAFVLVQRNITSVLYVMWCSRTPREPAAMYPRRNGLAKGTAIAFALSVLPTREQDVVAPKQMTWHSSGLHMLWMDSSLTLPTLHRMGSHGDDRPCRVMRCVILFGVYMKYEKYHHIILVIVRDLNRCMSTYSEWFKFVWPHFV